MAKDDRKGIIGQILKKNGIGEQAFGNPLVSEGGDHELEIMMANVTETFSKAEAVIPRSAREHPHFQAPLSDQL